MSNRKKINRYSLAATSVALTSFSAAAAIAVTSPASTEAAGIHLAAISTEWLPAPDSPHLPELQYSYYTKPTTYLGRTNPSPAEYSFATPADLGGHRNYRLFCKRAGLPQIPGGYGFLHCVDDGGIHVTRLTQDVPYLRELVNANPLMLAGLTIPASKFPLKRLGWPDE